MNNIHVQGKNKMLRRHDGEYLCSGFWVMSQCIMVTGSSVSGEPTASKFRAACFAENPTLQLKVTNRIFQLITERLVIFKHTI